MNEPTTQKQNWLQLLKIQAAGSISLPNLLTGQILCHKFGQTEALFAVILGNIFLALIGYFFASISARFHWSTAENAIYYFGNRGKTFFSALLFTTMICWFSIQLNIMTIGLKQLLKLFEIIPSHLILNIGLGIVITSFMSFGMKTLKLLSTLILPLILLTISLACCFRTDSPPNAGPLSISWLGGVSAVVGVNIAGAIDLPTFFRHAKSDIDGKICAILLYGLVVPFSEILGIYLAGGATGSLILEALQSGYSQLWMVWVSCFIILSGWTTNSANLYSAVVSSYTLTVKGSSISRTLALGAIGTAVACFDPLGNIERILDLFAILIGGMGAISISNYLFHKHQTDYPYSLLSWTLGVSCGICSEHFHWFITGVSSLDSFILAFAIQYFINTLELKRSPLKSNNL